MSNMPTEKPFETFVVGSLPRPQWVRDVIDERKAGQIDEAEADRLLDAAVPSAIRMQERAGLDYVSDGEWRRESYVKVFAEAVDGFANDVIETPSTKFSGLTYPAVVSKIRPRRSMTATEVAFLKANTSSKIIVAVPSPYTVGRRLWTREHSTKAYPEREEFMDAVIPVVRAELLELASAGVDAVQLDDPWLALLVDPSYREAEGITDVDRETELSVRCVNEATEGVEGLNLSVHMCHAHFNREHATTGPYDLIMSALGQMNVDRFAMELATPDAGGLAALKNFPADKVLGLGVIDHTDKHVETPQEVVERAERAMEYVDPSRLTLNPDCGFSPSSTNPMDFDEAYLKLRAMCEGATLLREKHG